MLLYMLLIYVFYGNFVEEFFVWKMVNKGFGGCEEKLKNFLWV